MKNKTLVYRAIVCCFVGNLFACSTLTKYTSNLMGSNDESDTPVQTKQPVANDGFVDVLPDFESLDPLYDLGFEGDFDKGLAEFNDKNYRQALAEWYPLAKDENPKAEYYLGLMYLNGLGMPIDFKQGTIWLQRSARRGYAQAQFEFGRLYITGQQIEQNYDQGIRWLLSAARQNHADAQFNYGLLYQQGKVPLTSDLMALYKKSSSEAFNLQQAAKWYQMAADQGHGAAQSNLASLYSAGLGVEQNDLSAIKWYTEAANQGVIDAQYHLGILYEQGKGTPMDLQEALFWHNKAADQGYLPSKQRLPHLLKMIDSFNNSLNLYGTTLALATRENLRVRLKGNEALPLREQDSFWFDIYESSKLLPKTDRLFVGYSLQTDQVASLEYRFPSQNDPNFVLSVLEMVTNKYGQPNKIDGDLNFGKLVYDWEVKDTVISVTRYWPDTSVYLSYKIGKSYQQMLSEMPANVEELQHEMKFETY